jgi:hypothetical protein
VLTEDQIAGRAGLPGPVVAELLHPGSGQLTAITEPQFRERDALAAQIAASMLCAGIRWRAVQLAVAQLPDDIAALAAARDQWSELVGRPRQSLPAVSIVTAVMALGLLVGLASGLLMSDMMLP